MFAGVVFLCVRVLYEWCVRVKVCLFVFVASFVVCVCGICACPGFLGVCVFM